MNIRRSLLKVLGLTAILSQITVFSVSAADTVKVGILLPLSGSVAPIGVNNRRGHEFAVEEINANGGIKALGGAKLEMIDGDTQGKPEIGIT
ncbi:MAG: ABC transporter substrate-binding protein, partial [Deltaproteobacteria bacterium]